MSLRIESMPIVPNTGLAAIVLTVSDRVAAGEAEDLSGPAVTAALVRHRFKVVESKVVSDDMDQVSAALSEATQRADLVVTTGGTGLSTRDRTPEATTAIATFLVPGIAEAIRRAGSISTPMAILSRGVAAVVGRCLVLNLPGSPAGAVESLDAVAEILPHALEVLGDADHSMGADHPTGADDMGRLIP